MELLEKIPSMGNTTKRMCYNYVKPKYIGG